MLYVLYGTDGKKAREKVSVLVDTLLSKKPDATVVQITRDNYTKEKLEEAIESQGLFESKLIVVLHTLLQDKDIQGEIEGVIQEFTSSSNIFIMLEEVLEKKILIKLSKYAEKIQACEVKESVPQKSQFNIFSLSDALGRRDREMLWTLYHKGKLKHLTPEEVHGGLMWSVKAMLIAKGSNTAEEAQLHPFAYKKAKMYANNFTTKELRNLSHNLMSLYHDVRRGKAPLDVALESLILLV